MNNKLEIDCQSGVLRATLIEYDALPFGNQKDCIKEYVEASSWQELMTKIGNKGWHDLLNKNE